MIQSILFFCLAFLIVVLVTPVVIQVSAQGIGLDHADETRKSQATPISRLGGLPIMVAMACCLGWIIYNDPAGWRAWMPLVVGSSLTYLLGLADDLRGVGAKVKFLGQIGTAVLTWWLGLSIDRVSYPGGNWSVELQGWSLYITVFWLVAVPNIMNLIDGFDGLAGGLALFMSVTLGVVGLQNEQIAVACYAFAMAGSLLGFLVYNFPPARIYLGDGGAYLLGFTIAGLSLRSSNKGSVAAVLIVTIVAMGIPILDTGFAFLRRAVRGYPVFSADDEHFHHRLQKLGLSKQRILWSAYGVAVVLSILGLSIVWSAGKTLPLAIGVLFVLALLVLKYFHKIHSFDDLRRKANRVIGRRTQVRYALLQSKVLEMEIERSRSAQEFYSLLEITLRRVGFTDEGEVDDQVVVRIRVGGGQDQVFHAPRAKGATGEWQRIAECFRIVLQKAYEKWPTR